MPRVENLALKYRPKRLEDVVGQKSVQVFLSKMVKDKRVPTALLFGGTRGAGKTSTARIIAASLNCNEPNAPCGECAVCKPIYNGTNTPDVTEIDAASNGGVESIRQLREQVMYSSSGNYRVILLDECHQITKDGFNALLKTLEEPPERTVFILLTTETNKIIETVLSRCQAYNFNRISVADIVSRLRYIVSKEGLEVSDDLLLLLAERANGGMRDAIMSLDQASRSGLKTAEEFAESLGEIDFGPTLLTLLAKGNYANIYKAVESYLISTGDAAQITNQLISTIRDVLILSGKASIPKQGKALDERMNLVSIYDSEKCLKVLKILWDLKTKVKGVEDQRAMLEIAVALIADSLAKKTPAANNNGNSSEKMSLSDLRSLQI